MPYIPYGYQPGYYGQAMPDQLAQLRQNAYQPPTMPGQAAQQPGVEFVTRAEFDALAARCAALEKQEPAKPETEVK